MGWRCLGRSPLARILSLFRLCIRQSLNVHRATRPNICQSPVEMKKKKWNQQNIEKNQLNCEMMQQNVCESASATCQQVLRQNVMHWASICIHSTIFVQHMVYRIRLLASNQYCNTEQVTHESPRSIFKKNSRVRFYYGRRCARFMLQDICFCMHFACSNSKMLIYFVSKLLTWQK